MSRKRETVAHHKLTGNSSKLTRNELAEMESEESMSLSKSALSELERLDSLIEQCMGACARGQTVGGKRNVAYTNLAILMKLRTHVAQQRKASESQADVLAEIDAALAGTK
jgi:hypothetical protein